MSFYSKLSPRDQKALTWGGGLMLVFLLYAMVWEPLTDKNEQLRSKIKQHQDNHQQLNQIVSRYNELKKKASPAAKSMQGSLFAMVDKTSQQQSIKKAIKKMTPVGNSKVNIRFEAVEFNAFVKWLVGISKDYGISVERINAQRDEAGKADIQLVIRS
ncbi:MAG: type II secretion system protein M [Gammaproteobacteria bacterium]|nr:type II secretion system protein M [Gammaproteobacteria bacterium]